MILERENVQFCIAARELDEMLVARGGWVSEVDESQVELDDGPTARWYATNWTRGRVWCSVQENPVGVPLYQVWFDGLLREEHSVTYEEVDRVAAIIGAGIEHPAWREHQYETMQLQDVGFLLDLLEPFALIEVETTMSEVSA